MYRTSSNQLDYIHRKSQREHKLPASNINTIPNAQPATAAHGMKILAALIDPKHRAGNANKLEQRGKAQRLGLENALQEREVDDAGLAEKGAEHGVVEHLVSEEGEFAAEDGFTLAAAGQGVEHVEEDEAGEGHGRVVGGYDARPFAEGLAVVEVAHLVDVDGECAHHDDHGGGENSLDEGFREHSRRLGPRGPVHDRGVYGLNSERLGRGAIHENV